MCFVIATDTTGLQNYSYVLFTEVLLLAVSRVGLCNRCIKIFKSLSK